MTGIAAERALPYDLYLALRLGICIVMSLAVARLYMYMYHRISRITYFSTLIIDGKRKRRRTLFDLPYAENSSEGVGADPKFWHSSF